MVSRSRRPAARESGLAADPLRVLLAVIWRQEAVPDVDDRVLGLARQLARRNLVEGLLLRACAERFPADEQRRLDSWTRLFWTNAQEAGRRLSAAGVTAIYIKSGLVGTAPEPAAVGSRPASGNASEYGDFDLVVGADGWARAIDALASWSASASRHPLEPGKILLQPPSGPGAHLHRRASWFGIPVIPTSRLRARARAGPILPGLLLPAPADELRLWTAHAVFQNLAFDLSELLQLRRLAKTEVMAEAAEHAGLEGWGRAFRRAMEVAASAMARLDAGDPVSLPLPLPPLASVADGVRHAAHLLGAGHPATALREVLLRPAVVAAKHRRLLWG